MSNALFPEQDDPPPHTPPYHPFTFKHFATRKTVLLSGMIVAILGMGTYIMVSPAEKQQEIVSIIAPVITPTPTEIPPTPTEVPPTPIPLPTSTPMPTFTPTPTIPPGTAWKTYANTKQGYRIKYSPDWAVKDLGELEPKIPSYVTFNQATASESSRFITIGVTTRSYDEQLALGASSSAITVAGIKGTKQFFRDSDGNTSTVIVLPRKSDLVVIRAKTAYLPIFNLMLSTLYVAK